MARIPKGRRPAADDHRWASAAKFFGRTVLSRAPEGPRVLGGQARAEGGGEIGEHGVELDG